MKMRRLPMFPVICVLVAVISVHLAIQVETVNLGVIVMDSTNSYTGKIAKTAIKLAVEDVNNGSHLLNALFLHPKTPLQTVLAGLELLGREVVALIVAETSEAAPFLSDLGEAANVPFLSLSDSSPALSNHRFPFFVRFAHSDRIQMKGIASLIKHYAWRSVAFLHSDHDFGSGAASALRDALQDLNCEIVYTTMIPSTAQKRTIREELSKLRTTKSSVFVVHTPCDLTIHLLMEAQEMGMMEAGYVWITTQEFTSLWDYVLNSSTMSSLQGLLGIKSIIPNSKQLNDFTQRWERQFRLDNPNIKNFELNSYGVLAYDVVLMISRVIEKMERNAKLSFMKPASSLGVMANPKIKVFEQGGKLLQEIFSTNFAGLGGNVKFLDGELQYGNNSHEIVNVVGKSYQAVGYLPYNSSKLFKTPSLANEGLRFVIWPGGLSTVPRDWVSPKTLKIAVPVTGWEQFVNVSFNTQSTNGTALTGFIIDLFNAVVKRLDYQLHYKLIPIYWNNDSYDELIRQVYLKKYDAVVGDVTITAKRTEFVDFTQPFTETGLVIVARMRTKEEGNDAWTFLQPFTPALWAATAAFVLYTGLVVWLLEHKINPDFRGSSINEVVTLLWFAFSTVFNARQERIRNSLSRIVVVVWVFVAFVLTSSYAANLSSRLTAQQITPAINGLANYKVGYHSSYAVSFLTDELGIPRKQLNQTISQREVEEALSKGGKNGGVDAILDEVPYLRPFRCGYSIVGPKYRSGGFGFVFSKGSSLVQDFSWAILNLLDSGEIKEIEDKYFKTSTCTSSNDPKYYRLDVKSFQGLYLITGIVSSLALVIFLSQALYNFSKATIGLGQNIPKWKFSKSFVKYIYQE